MVFASPLFLFLFLPATLGAYFAFPRRVRNPVLLAASLAFYTWGEARYVPLVLGSVAFNWWMGLRIAGATAPAARRRRLTLAVAGNLAVLVAFKYADFAIANLNAVAPFLGIQPVVLAAIPLPLGISFFTFHAISYVVDVYKRTAAAQRNLPAFALYILLFPQLIAGPIIRYRDIAAQLVTHDARLADFAYGIRRFVIGLGKKLLIANTLGQTADTVFALPGSGLTTTLAWLGLVCYTLQIYFDFSGYSDMAIGLMRMFGFRILENFNYPYIARSVREFWQRWHISLSNWFRDYLYIPLGGNRSGNLRAYRNLFIVFTLCGLWHGAFLVIERAGPSRLLARSAWISHAYALAAVMGGWVLFRCDTLAHAADYFIALAGLSGADPSAHPVAQQFNALLALTLTAGVLFATPIARRLGDWRERISTGVAAETPAGVVRGSLVMTADLAWLALVFVASAAMLAAGTYNPFIYFRF